MRDRHEHEQRDGPMNSPIFVVDGHCHAWSLAKDKEFGFVGKIHCVYL